MAKITPYKIATRAWSLENIGESSGSTGRSLVKTSSLNTNDLNDCISLNDLNQNTSTNYIIPASKSDGAVPNSVIADGNKCVTQTYVDSLYANKIININTNIHYKTSSGGTLVAMPYSITITAEYNNIVLGDLTNRFNNIYTDLLITVKFSYDKPADGISPTIKNYNYASATYTLPANPNHNGTLTFDLLSASGSSGLNSGTTTQGELSVTDFLNRHLSGMYRQYANGEIGNYSINVYLTPEYNFLPNLPYTPHKHICYHNITTTASESSSMTQLTCDCLYNCTSNPVSVHIPLIPGQTYTWGFKITMSNFSPTQTSSPANDVALSNGGGTNDMNIDVSKSWNSSSKTLTITGTATCVPTTIDVPSIKVTYSKTGDYIPFVESFKLDWETDVETDRT